MRCQHSAIQIYDLRTGTTTLVKEFDTVVEAPNWGKDGKLYYNSEGKLWTLDLATKEIIHIDTGEADTVNNDHVLGFDGKTIAFSSGVKGSWESRIFIKDLVTGEVRRVVDTVPSFLHGYSPDGTKLAYCAARYCGAPELEWDVYIANADGTGETRLTESYGLNDGPEFSPDGKEIWFNSVRSGRMQAYKMNIDGTNQTQMTFDKTMNAWFPHISPDGEKVVYIAYHQEDLGIGEHLPDKNVEIRLILPGQSREEKTLIRFFGGQGSMNVNSWAPNSQQFAFVSYR